MRDLLTAIAVLVIAVLTAALVAPPFIDWSARRGFLERLIGDALGVEAKTEGRIRVRLLPAPRIRLERLRLGPASPDAPALSLAHVRTDIALTPLLRGEVRFQDARIARAEIRLPMDAEGGWRLQKDFLSGGLRRDWAFEELAVAELLLTMTTPATGRTDQIEAEAIRAEGQSLAGPWRVEGRAGAASFRLVTGEWGAGPNTPVKLIGGGDRAPRFDIDAKVAFTPDRDSVPVPAVSGTARVTFGPPAQTAASGPPIPIAVQSSFNLSGRVIALDGVSVEAGEGATSLRLVGAGAIWLDEPRIALTLEGRRFDADGFLSSVSGRALLARAGTWTLPPLPVPVDLDLTLPSMGLGLDEWSNLTVSATLLRDRIAIEKADVVAPGQTRIALEGVTALALEGSANGRVALATAASDRFARTLANLGLSGPLAAPLAGGRLEAAADVTLAPPVLSFRNARVILGDTTLTGNLRYTAPDEGLRGRLEAQVAAQGVEFAQLPQMASFNEATRGLDLNLMLDARAIRYGGQAGAGRIAAHVLSDGPELVVQTLDIVDLAGANARVSGRIARDGSGRIAGKVTARRAAPLIDLLGRVWVGGVARLVPRFLREGALDLDVVAERAAGASAASGTLPLKTIIRGTAAGGPFEADVLSVEGRTERMTLRLATDNTGRWIDKPDAPRLRRPSSLDIRGVRPPSGPFQVTASGDVGGLAIRTGRPFVLGPDDDGVVAGEADLSASDVTPFLSLFGDGVGVGQPVPVQLRVVLGQDHDASRLKLSGRVADGAFEASLLARALQDVSGAISLERLSLPWLAAAFALDAALEPRPGAPWSTARFGDARVPLSIGPIAVRAHRVDLGRGYVGHDAAFNVVVSPDDMTVRDLDATLAGGRLTGFFTIARQGSLASLTGEGAIRDARLPGLLAAGPFDIDAGLSGALRFGASGQTIAALIANLGGTGTLSLTDLQIPNADPGGISRALARVLAASDPLASGQLQAIVTKELARAPLRAASVSAPVTLIGGTMRMSPFVADAGSGAWRGAVSYDVKTLTLEARGTLSTKEAPKGWIGSTPYVALNWRGPIAAPVRELDAGPLVNGVAAVVLQRELEKVEAFEVDANERARHNQRRDMDRLRRAAEEEARRAADQAAPQVQLRQDPREVDGARVTPGSIPLPLDIRPAPPVQTQ